MQKTLRPRSVLACLARVGLCASALLLESVALVADEPSAANARDGYRDLQVMVRARRALAADKVLGPLNLGVRVRDGVAVLWGAVPSADLIPTAVQRVEVVQGVLGVRSELYLATPEKELDPLPFAAATAEPTRREAASPDPASGTIDPLLSHNEPRVVLPPASAEKRAAAPTDPPAVTGRHPEHEMPRATETSQARPRPEPAATAAPELAELVERVRKADPRFRPLRVEVRGSHVFIAGGGEQGESVMALAQAVSRLPGVGRVTTRADDTPRR